MNAQTTQILALGALALVPLLVVILLGLMPKRKQEQMHWRTGNLLDSSVLPVVRPVVLEPLVSQLRCMHGSEMNGYAVGLRHLPVEASAPVLRYLQRCADPAVELFAQTVLQAAKEELQSVCGRLEEKADHCSERGMASLLETGLRLSHPALTPASEKEGWMARLVAHAEQALTRFPQPSCRLTAAVVNVFLAGHRLDCAAILVARLPQDSPLLQELSQALAFSARKLPIIDS